ncbi:MAG: hypothetical protein RBR77_14615 [Thauera sp.]|jgi:hypothetical protein|nr:hypothetical protein [Thauera sp.]
MNIPVPLRIPPLRLLNCQHRHQRGQAMTEYLIASTLVLLLLLGSSHGGDESSALGQLLAAVRTAFERFSHFVSLPL